MYKMCIVMKRLILFGSLILATSFACQKENIQKRGNSIDLVSLDGSNSNNGNNTRSTTPTRTTGSTDSPDSGTGITDPNNDPDLNKRKIKN